MKQSLAVFEMRSLKSPHIALYIVFGKVAFVCMLKFELE